MNKTRRRSALSKKGNCCIFLTGERDQIRASENIFFQIACTIQGQGLLIHTDSPRSGAFQSNRLVSLGHSMSLCQPRQEATINYI